jgi:hypothetical protein
MVETSCCLYQSWLEYRASISIVEASQILGDSKGAVCSGRHWRSEKEVLLPLHISSSEFNKEPGAHRNYSCYLSGYADTGGCGANRRVNSPTPTDQRQKSWPFWSVWFLQDPSL